MSAGSTTIAATVGSVKGSLSLTTIANAWTPAASMSVARVNHTATLLQNNEVLVVGGTTDSSGEIYDPVSNRWAGIANLVTLSGHTATLLANGKVLIAGGIRIPYLPPHWTSSNHRVRGTV